MNLRVWGYEDARIPTNTHEPEGMRMWGCEDASKHTQTWEYDISMWVCENTTKYTGTWLYENVRIQDASKNMWTSGYKDVRMSTSTHELYRVWGCKYVRMPKSTHKTEAMRIWRCEDTSKHTWTWRYEDIRMRDIHMNLSVQESMEVRLEESTWENTFLAYIY